MTGQPDPTWGGAEAPVCPRHPSVVSYVRCARCGRPTCPDCQRPAPVGIQCVDCVAEGQKGMRRATGRYGGAVETRGTPVTLTIIGLCVIVYLAQVMTDSSGITGPVTRALAFVPALGKSEPWRFLTCAFGHLGVTHILFNMLALWQVGTGLEQLFGRWRYLALYLLAALAGSVGYLLLASPPSGAMDPAGTAWVTGSLGASGAVFGIFGAYLVVAIRNRLNVTSMLVLLAINAAIGFSYPGIAWQAHLGGFIGGAVVAGLLVFLGERSLRRWQWPALGLVLALLVVLAVAKYATVPPEYLA